MVFQANHPGYPALNEAVRKAFGVIVYAISTSQTLGKIKVIGTWSDNAFD
ncbi:hypothetical protein AM10699_65750 (plasmid) [Acaryochloris marina MBIC10699]|nr:hypothetical protein AM10699_65750 [Acaryochloris marina MBIC10699]